MSSPAVTETIIRPTRGLRALNWRELWTYRDLLWLLVWREFASKYKQTVLGPLWFIVQPLLTTLVFTIVFGRVARIPTGGVPPTLFYLCGLLPWNYFAQTFQSTSATLANNAGLFGKVYFPRLIVPLSAVVSNLLAFAIQLVTFAVFYGIYKASEEGVSFGVAWSAVLLPLVVVQVAALSLGIGLWISAITAKYRDFTILASFVIQLWLYATPVIYPLSQIPQKWQTVVAFNPMTMPVEIFRAALLGTVPPAASLVALSIGLTVVLLASGVTAFQKAEKTFVDVI